MRILATAMTLLAFSAAAHADEYVSGYERRDGTYVEPYDRTAPNDTKTDNYSYPENGREYQNPDSAREFSSDPGNAAYSGSAPGSGGPANGSTLWGQ